MLSSHIFAIELGFLIPWLIETLILAYFLIYTIVEPMISFIVRKIRLLRPSSTFISVCPLFTRLCNMLLRRLKTGYRWAQARSQEHTSSSQSYEYLLHQFRKCCRGFETMPPEVQIQAGIFSAKVTLCVMQFSNSIRSWASNLITSICLWILKKQTGGAYRVAEDVRDALSHLPVGDEHRLRIPTTEIQGVLDSATIHKAYYILVSSSLTFRQLRPAMRSAIISRIVHDTLNYDRSMGHIWSPTNTFGLAAQILRSQLNADWFDRYLEFQLANNGTKLGQNASDITATFISTVFLISCGFPTSGGSGAGTMNFANESVSLSSEATINVACPTIGPPKPTSQKTRNSTLPGYSRQWHAVNRE